MKYHHSIHSKWYQWEQNSNPSSPFFSFSFFYTLFIFGSAGSLLLRGLFSSCSKWGCSLAAAPSSRACGINCCSAQAQLLCDCGIFLGQGSIPCVSCIGRRVLYLCTTGEALSFPSFQMMLTSLGIFFGNDHA